MGISRLPTLAFARRTSSGATPPRPSVALQSTSHQRYLNCFLLLSTLSGTQPCLCKVLNFSPVTRIFFPLTPTPFVTFKPTVGTYLAPEVRNLFSPAIYPLRDTATGEVSLLLPLYGGYHTVQYPAGQHY
jgi:hypothetical protein